MKVLTSAIALLMISMPVAAQSPKGMPDPSKGFMMQFDSNKDEKVTLEEFKAPQVQRIEHEFKRMDKNQDGNVDNKEFKAFMEEMRKFMDQKRKEMEQMRQQQGQGKQ